MFQSSLSDLPLRFLGKSTDSISLMVSSLLISVCLLKLRKNTPWTTINSDSPLLASSLSLPASQFPIPGTFQRNALIEFKYSVHYLLAINCFVLKWLVQIRRLSISKQWTRQHNGREEVGELKWISVVTGSGSPRSLFRCVRSNWLCKLTISWLIRKPFTTIRHKLRWAPGGGKSTNHAHRKRFHYVTLEQSLPTHNQRKDGSRAD